MTSFSHSTASKPYEIHAKASITLKDLGRISIHVMTENWHFLKDTLAFYFRHFLCIRLETESCLLTSDLLLNIYHWLSVSRQ